MYYSHHIYNYLDARINSTLNHAIKENKRSDCTHLIFFSYLNKLIERPSSSPFLFITLWLNICHGVVGAVTIYYRQTELI
jgi:hypothetical protein